MFGSRLGTCLPAEVYKVCSLSPPPPWGAQRPTSPVAPKMTATGYGSGLAAVFVGYGVGLAGAMGCGVWATAMCFGPGPGLKLTATSWVGYGLGTRAGSAARARVKWPERASEPTSSRPPTFEAPRLESG